MAVQIKSTSRMLIVAARLSGSALSGAWRLVAGDASAVAIPEEGYDFVFSATGEYDLSYEVTDGERTTVSPTVRVEVLSKGKTIQIR